MIEINTQKQAIFWDFVQNNLNRMPMQRCEISRKSGLARELVHKLLQQYVKEGVIVQPERGFYHYLPEMCKKVILFPQGLLNNHGKKIDTLIDIPNDVFDSISQYCNKYNFPIQGFVREALEMRLSVIEKAYQPENIKKNIDYSNIKQFISEMCIRQERMRVQAGPFFTVYSNWCAERKQESLNVRQVSQWMEKHFKAKKDRTGKYYYGLHVNTKNIIVQPQKEDWLFEKHKISDTRLTEIVDSSVREAKRHEKARLHRLRIAHALEERKPSTISKITSCQKPLHYIDELVLELPENVKKKKYIESVLQNKMQNLSYISTALNKKTDGILWSKITLVNCLLNNPWRKTDCDFIFDYSAISNNVKAYRAVESRILLFESTIAHSRDTISKSFIPDYIDILDYLLLLTCEKIELNGQKITNDTWIRITISSLCYAIKARYGPEVTIGKRIADLIDFGLLFKHKKSDNTNEYRVNYGAIEDANLEHYMNNLGITRDEALELQNSTLTEGKEHAKKAK